MQFGAWNVGTLMDTIYSNRSEPMTAIVAHELSRYNIDIAALSETRLAGTGHLAEVGAGYTFFWCGRAADEPREAGVGFAIRTVLIPKLKTFQKGSTTGWWPCASLWQATSTSPSSAHTPRRPPSQRSYKEQFYQVLRDTLRSVPGNDKLLLMDDFNACTERAHSARWTHSIHHSVTYYEHTLSV